MSEWTAEQEYEDQQKGRGRYAVADDDKYPARGGGTMSENSGYAFQDDVRASAIFRESLLRDAESEPRVADESIRIGILIEAGDLIDGDRNNQYGPPTQDFQRTADMWRALFGWEVDAARVAMAMACLKLSRLAWNPGKRDSWVDLAGYAACGFEAHEESW